MLSDSNLSLPPEWTGEKRTRTQLKRDRNALSKPHHTYDLDRDGTVSQQDFRLSKFFDRDRDGRLNTQERLRASGAIASGEATVLLEPKTKWPFNRQPLLISHEEYDSRADAAVRTRTELVKKRHDEIASVY